MLKKWRRMRCVQYYLMADVLDTQITGLKTRLSKTSSVEDVKNFHDRFETMLQASLFLIILSSPSPCPKSQIKVQCLKSKVQRKGTGTGADTLILQATHHT